jgi:four helix bundle protein
MIKSFSDIEAYQLAHHLSMEIFRLTKIFPTLEKFSLTSQIIRSSRSVAANIAEGWGKRNYPQEFRRHLVYSTGSLEETKSWLKFALDCNYINIDQYQNIYTQLDQLGAKLYKLFQNWK